MAQLPRLTFAIPFYSNLAYLKESILSVLGQTLGDWRCIVVDDYSPEDGAGELVKSFGDPRLEYRRNPKNLGLAGNWNACLEYSNTQFVTILHSDDRLLCRYAETMLNAYARNPDAAAIFSEAVVIDRAGKRIFSFPDFVKKFIRPDYRHELTLQGDQGAAALFRGHFIMCPTLCYNMQRLSDHRFSNRWQMVLDMAFLVDLLIEGQKIVGVPDIVYEYRRHATNQTTKHTQSLLRFEEEVAIYSRYGEKIRQIGWHAAGQVAGKKRIIKLNLFYCIVKDLLQTDWRSAKKKWAFLINMNQQYKV